MPTADHPARSSLISCRPKTRSCTDFIDQNYVCTTLPTLSSMNQNCVPIHNPIKSAHPSFPDASGTSQLTAQNVRLPHTPGRKARRYSWRCSWEGPAIFMFS